MSKSNAQKIKKPIVGFFRFWKDFLVGDSPVLALGVLIILGVAYLLHNSGLWAPVAAIVMVLFLITFTVWQKARARISHR